MKNDIRKNPIHLGRKAKTFAEPAFTGMEWYAEYGKRHKEDGVEGRLVSMHTFTEPWDSWEVHPNGSEAVICIKGKITLIQEIDGKEKEIVLNESEYAINPPGVWHTADAIGETTVLFITAGEGTEHKPR